MSITSIVIPVWNRVDYLAECLDSLIGQNAPDWEAVVVDDGSTDGTRDLLQDFQTRDSRIRGYDRPASRPKGANACRNLGLENVRGEQVIFLDSDDLLASHAVGQRKELLDSHQDEGFVVTQGFLFEKAPDDLDLRISREEIGDPLTRLLYFDWPWTTCQPTWRRSALTKHSLRWHEHMLWAQNDQFDIDAHLAGLGYHADLGLPPDSYHRTGGDGRGQITNSFGTKAQLDSSRAFFFSLGKELRRRKLDTPERMQNLHALTHWFCQKYWLETDSRLLGAREWVRAVAGGNCRSETIFEGLAHFLTRRTRLGDRFDGAWLETRWGTESLWKKEARSFGHPPIN